MKTCMRQQLIHIVLQIGNAGTLVAQGCQDGRQRFECFISGTLLTRNFIYRWLQLILHVLSFRGHVPDQLIQPHCIHVAVPPDFGRPWTQWGPGLP